MKQISLILLSFIVFSINSKANLEVYFMYSDFYSPQGPYLETYLSVIGNSAVFVKNDNNKYHSEIEITMIFKQENNIITFNKYILKSPEITDTSVLKPNFIDLQRISIPNGIYKFELHIKDLHDTRAEVYKLSDIIDINFNEFETKYSGIQFIESIMPSKEENILTKGSYDLIPYISNYFPENISKLTFYTELYNVDKIVQGEFLIKYYIESFETGKIDEISSRFKKYSSAPIVAILGELNIEKLSSGNYYLVVEALDRENRLIQRTKFFFRRNKGFLAKNDLNDLLKKFDISNTFTGKLSDKDSMMYYVGSLRPIANTDERSFIDYRLKKSTLDEMQNFFLEFWVKRNNVDPNSLWIKYKEQVDFVDKFYSTPIRRGYETDRGRVYLQYGAPNDKYISKHEPSAYPYEIWTYYRVGNENNRKFIFYNPNIAGQDYELLHSDLTGEIKTPNWERVLQKRNNTLYNQDLKNADDSWGSRAADEYRKK